MYNFPILQQATSLGHFLVGSYLFLKGLITNVLRWLKTERDFFCPEETALLPDQKSYFDIAFSEESTDKMVARWKLLQSLSCEKGGRLFLFIPPEKEDLLRILVDNNDIEAVIVPFNFP